MNCTNCGTNLAPGTVACPLCGKPSPYSNPGANDPTIAASYNIPLPPSTSYGSQPYGQNPYGAPAPNPYETVPSATNPYGSPAQNPYAPPPVQSQYGYVPPQPPPQRRNRTGLIVGIVILLAVLLGGIILAFSLLSRSNTQGNIATPTPIVPATPTQVPTPQATGPSGAVVSPTAALIITNPRMSSTIDSNYYPTHLTTNFVLGKDIYVTYNLNLQGHTGYAEAKWYGDNKFIFVGKVLALNDPTFDHGYFGAVYHIPTNGLVELYWCTKADCSDAQLAQIATFTVS